jgi:hypothetical protein
MKLPTPIIEIQECPQDLFEYLKETFIKKTEWTDTNLLTKEEAFYDQSFRYEAITKYFNTQSYFYSVVPPTDETTEKIKPYTDYLLGDIFKEHTLFRCQIVCLKPGQNDPRFYHMYGKRIHLPLVINDKSFHVHFPPDKNYEMQFSKMTEGIITDFDNITPHSAFNYGDTERIHIICDIVQNKTVEKLEQALKGYANATNPKILEEYYFHVDNIEKKYNCKNTELKENYLEVMPKYE